MVSKKRSSQWERFQRQGMFLDLPKTFMGRRAIIDISKLFRTFGLYWNILLSLWLYSHEKHKKMYSKQTLVFVNRNYKNNVGYQKATQKYENRLLDTWDKY